MGDAPDAQRGARAGGVFKRLWPVGLLVLVVVAVVASGATRYLSLQQLAASRGALADFVSAHFAAALAAYAATYVCLALFSIPGGLLMTMTGGFLFGPWVGAPATIVSATTGASLLFLVARSSIGEFLRVRAGPKIARLRAGFAEDAVSYLLFLRLTPLFPFPLVNLAPALLGVKFRTFVWTTLVGITPGAFAYSLAGSGLESVLEAQEAAYRTCMAAARTDCGALFNLRHLVTRELILSLAAVGVLALAPVLLKRLRIGRFAAARNPETPAP